MGMALDYLFSTLETQLLDRAAREQLCRRILLKESEHLTGERPQGAEGGATDGPQPRGDVTWTHTEALYSLGPSVPHVDSHTTTPHPPSPPLYGRS